MYSRFRWLVTSRPQSNSLVGAGASSCPNRSLIATHNSSRRQHRLVIRQDFLNAVVSVVLHEHEHAFPRPRDHDIEQPFGDIRVPRSVMVLIDVRENHRIELQPFAGFCVDDQDPAFVEGDFGAVFSVKCVDGRARIVHRDIFGAKPIEVALANLVVRRDHTDELTRIPIREPKDTSTTEPRASRL